MKRVGLSEDTVITNGNLTDEMIEKANAFVDERMAGTTEVSERVCHLWNDRSFINQFSIDCETRSEYRSYEFIIENGDVKFKKIEGDFKD